MKPVSDIHVSSNLVLPSPLDLLAQLPPSDTDTDFIFQSRRAIREIIFGNDPRLLVIAAPAPSTTSPPAANTPNASPSSPTK